MLVKRPRQTYQRSRARLFASEASAKPQTRPMAEGSSSGDEEEPLAKSRHDLLHKGMVDRLHDEMEYHLAGLEPGRRQASRLTALRELIDWAMLTGQTVEAASLFRAHGLLSSMSEHLGDLLGEAEVAEGLLLLAAWLGQTVRNLLLKPDLMLAATSSLLKANHEDLVHETRWRELPRIPAADRQGVAIWALTRLQASGEGKLDAEIRSLAMEQGLFAKVTTGEQALPLLALLHRLRVRDQALFHRIYHQLPVWQEQQEWETIAMALLYLTEVSAQPLSDSPPPPLRPLCALIPQLGDDEAGVYGLALLTNLIDRDAGQCDSLRLEPDFLDWLVNIALILEQRGFYAAIVCACCADNNSCWQMLLGMQPRLLNLLAGHLFQEKEIASPELAAALLRLRKKLDQ